MSKDIAGSIKEKPLIPDMEADFKLTGRRHDVVKTGEEAKEVITNFPALDLSLWFYLKMSKGDDIGEHLISAFFNDLGPYLYQKGVDSVNACPREDRAIRDVIPKDLFAPGGRYAEMKELQGKPVNARELKAMSTILCNFLEQYGDLSTTDLCKQATQLAIVKEMRHNGRYGKKKAGSTCEGNELTSSTVRNRLLVVSRAFECLREDGEVDVNPIRKALQLLPNKTESRSFQPLPKDLYVQILSTPSIWTDFFALAMIVLLCETGMRIGEAEALQVKNINLKNQVLTITQSVKKGGVISQTKTRSTREIPLSRLAIDALSPMLVGKKEDDFVFSLDGKKPFTRIKYARALNNALSAVGLSMKEQQQKGYCLHSSRHWFISALVSKNVSDANISLITGHDTTRLSTMNLRYTAQLREAYPAIIEAIDSFFGPEETEAIEKALDTLCPRWWKKEVTRK